MRHIPNDINELCELVLILLDELESCKVRLSSVQSELLSVQTDLSLLQSENAGLRLENADLKSQLGFNSTQSHKPPTSDGFNKPPILKLAQ